MEKERLIITDRGDGFGYDSIINYFVPGRSSNASQWMGKERRLEGVTGRFGQGGISPLYFLLYHTLSDSSIVPSFRVEKDSTTLTFLFSSEGERYEALCRRDKNKGRVQIEIRALNAKNCKKISIKSWRGDEALSEAVVLPEGGGPLLLFGIRGIFAAMPFAVWLFLAIEQLPLAGEVAADPKRDMPKGIILGIFTLIATGFLILVINLLLPHSAYGYGSSSEPILDGFRVIYGTGWAKLLSLAAVVGLTGWTGF